MLYLSLRAKKAHFAIGRDKCHWTSSQLSAHVSKAKKLAHAAFLRALPSGNFSTWSHIQKADFFKWLSVHDDGPIPKGPYAYVPSPKNPFFVIALSFSYARVEIANSCLGHAISTRTKIYLGLVHTWHIITLTKIVSYCVCADILMIFPKFLLDIKKIQVNFVSGQYYHWYMLIEPYYYCLI